MAFEVPPLPYDYNALEPHIDEATMKVHHDKHHQAYVDKANAALEGTEFESKSIEEILQNLDALGDKKGPVRNNGGGHYNHSLFWESMSPNGGGEPDGALGDAIDSAFGSFADFQAKFKETGVNQFGSGWSWLVHDGSGLAVVGTPNQDNPISQGQTPLLGVDVWEHAYYLKYQNRRPDYIDAWWNTVDWGKVSERYLGGRRLTADTPFRRARAATRARARRSEDSMTSRSLLAALLAATALAVPAAPALASSTQESIIEDEHQMLGLGPAERDAALNDAQALGADGDPRRRAVALDRALARRGEAAEGLRRQEPRGLSRAGRGTRSTPSCAAPRRAA